MESNTTTDSPSLIGVGTRRAWPDTEFLPDNFMLVGGIIYARSVALLRYAHLIAPLIKLYPPQRDHPIDRKLVLLEGIIASRDS